MEAIEIEEKIISLNKRKSMAEYQRKITTSLLTVIEYDNEISIIDRKIEQLNYKLKAIRNQPHPGGKEGV